MEIKRPPVSFGTVYYPEEWNEEQWETDASLMQKLGLGLVRMGDDAWAQFEPAEGNFNFEWIDKAIEIFASHRIKTVLCVPLSVIPAWLSKKCNTIEPCFSNEEYRSHCASFAAAMAEHFSTNQNVVGYQIFARIGGNARPLKNCTCNECTVQFQKWLEKKYSTTEKLSRSWGASRAAAQFSEIRLFDQNQKYHTPAQTFDYRTFRSDAFASLVKKTVQAMRPHSGSVCITADFCGYPDELDFAKAAASLDFAAGCNFPDKGRPTGSVSHEKVVQTASRLEYLRGTKGGTFWIMEQQCGAAGWGTQSRTPNPGRIRLWTAQAVAHGVDTLFFSAWRQRVAETEDFNDGILPLNGNKSRRSEEIQRTLMVLKPALSDIRGNMKAFPCNIIYSAEEKWATEARSGHEDFSYTSCITEYYQAFFDRNIPVDIINSDRDFKYSKLVVAPFLYQLDRGLQARLDSYVMAGGTLILTTRSGIKSGSGALRTDSPAPCGLSNMAGVIVTETDCLRDGPMMLHWTAPLPTVRSIQAPGAGLAKKAEPLPMPSVSQMYGRYWADIITALPETKVLAEYAGDGFYKGTPALTMHHHGRGTVYYVGTQLSPALIRLLIAHATATAEIPRSYKTPMGVEVIRRSGSENDWLFIINHTHSQVKLDNPPISLGAMGVRVMAVAKTRAKTANGDDSAEKIPE